MPQMSPMLWELIYLSITVLMMFLLTKNFFYDQPSVNVTLINMNPVKEAMFWQW